MLNQNPVTEEAIRDMARTARGGIRRIFLHWTGGHYGTNEDAYHICIDRDGKEMGYDIVTNNKGAFLGERKFDNAELRLLIDSVLFSNNLPTNIVEVRKTTTSISKWH